MVTLCSAGVTLGVVELLRRGFAWRTALGTAVLLAVAYLSKITAIALAVPVSYALVRGKKRLSTRLLHASVLLLTLAIVLPWSLRNVRLYGDPFASAAMGHSGNGHASVGSKTISGGESNGAFRTGGSLP